MRKVIISLMIITLTLLTLGSAVQAGVNTNQSSRDKHGTRTVEPTREKCNNGNGLPSAVPSQARTHIPGSVQTRQASRVTCTPNATRTAQVTLTGTAQATRTVQATRTGTAQATRTGTAQVTRTGTAQATRTVQATRTATAQATVQATRTAQATEEACGRGGLPSAVPPQARTRIPDPVETRQASRPTCTPQPIASQQATRTAEPSSTAESSATAEATHQPHPTHPTHPTHPAHPTQKPRSNK